MYLSAKRPVWALLMCVCLLAGPACDGDGGNSVCGNGAVEAGEECDDGNTADGDGCSATCQTEGNAECGNGTLEAGEECDDGNTDDGDGCSATCMSEGGTYSVSGTAGRVAGTCPDAYGSIGTLCISIRSDCADIATEVASTSVANADMSMPIDGPVGFQGEPVSFTVVDIPDGTWQVYTFLDLDSAGCGDVLATGDLTEGLLCQEVTVSGANVTDVIFEFNAIAP